MTAITFSTFRKAANQAKKIFPYCGTVLALDPGETTGWALFQSSQDDVLLSKAGQLKTWGMPNCVRNMTDLIKEMKPTIVVHEVYSVYEWKSQDHSWSEVPTIHVIGCIETLCIQQNILFLSQTAQIAKNFCTDDKLKSWNYYIKGERHSRDAIRHGCYFLAFGNPKPTVCKS